MPLFTHLKHFSLFGSLSYSCVATVRLENSADHTKAGVVYNHFDDKNSLSTRDSESSLTHNAISQEKQLCLVIRSYINIYSPPLDIYVS